VFHVKQGTPPALRFLDAALADAAARDLLRERPAPSFDPKSFCSNDYLGLADAVAPPHPAGSGASRLVCGERQEHVDLEAAAAQLVGQEAALVFTSGYAANLGILSALAGPDDLIVSDALNHASIIDGARLSRARVVVVPHCDVGAVRDALGQPRNGRAFVVTESYFSMDADGPDLPALRAVADAGGAALIVDEAHAVGVFGPVGGGRCADAGVTADVVVGTFGKAFGAGGAFVAGSSTLVRWLWNRARSFVFSTGISPAVAAAALANMRTASHEPERRARVLENARFFRGALERLDLRPLGFGPIVPWVIGEPGPAMRAAAALRDRGIDVRAIRPPSVAPGTARLRLTVTARHDPGDLEQAAQWIGEIAARRP
jgi:8-amino-7-oxononanoate synthase